MEIVLQNSIEGKVLNNGNQSFIIMHLMGTTLLLTKAKQGQKVEKNISFELGENSYYGTFLRNVNIPYSRKLSQLIEYLGISRQPNLQHNWLLFYEVHEFRKNDYKKYRVETPIYGGEALIHTPKGQRIKCLISNLFKLGGQTFYFVNSSCQIHTNFSIITDFSNQVIYGIVYCFERTVICLPFQLVLTQKHCPLKIADFIRPLLLRTCYLSFHGSYCTGFLLNQKTVISARHVIPFEYQKIGLELRIKLYPYQQQKIGVIKRIGQGSVDFLEVTLLDQFLSKQVTSYSESYHNFSSNVTACEEHLVGQQALTLGFGKYSYSDKIFSKVDLVMPTVETGTISKIIKVGHSSIYIKTDAALYNGFSGCGLWLGDKLIGMAIFILKNKSTQSNYNRHNFSYTIDFIQRVLSFESDELLISEINPQLECFDRIQSRHKIVLLPRL